jgi:hypothetical protein
MTLLQVKSTTEWIQTRLANLSARPDTTAYVIGVLACKDLTNLVDSGSITLAFAKAGIDFDSHRRLADGVLASEIAFHGWLVEPTLCVDFARRSYSTCFYLLGGSWDCYGELADRLPEIINASREAWLSCQTRIPHVF